MPDRFELSPEARRVVAQVTEMEQKVRALRDDFENDLLAARRAAVSTKTAAIEKLVEARAILAAEASDLEDLRGVVTRAKADLEKQRGEFQALVRNPPGGIEFVASAWADYELARAEAEAEALEDKSRPALLAAHAVREKGRELAEMRRRAKRAEWLAAFYEWHVPWLGELRDVEEEESFIETVLDDDLGPSEASSTNDPARAWLSEREYNALAETDRNQRALDRYLRSPKTRWQIGRDYERYVGYLCEQDGDEVEYKGIIAGFDDLGRDVIARRGSNVRIIQCKRWSASKTIHEKHVFQLFGTVVAAQIDDPHLNISGEFVTTTRLSERALNFAVRLGIAVRQEFAQADYPRIKCNRSPGTGDGIYHLPFDQQYDSTVIEPHRGECYVATIAEAEQLGFRRARRWRGLKA